MATRRRAGFGQTRKLPSNRWQARYTVPGTDRRVNAPTTFDTKGDAEEWLSGVRTDLTRGAWLPTETRLTFGAYAEEWLAHHTLKPRSVDFYRGLLDDRILPTFGHMRIVQITPTQVRAWYGRQPKTTPTRTSHAYGALRTILNTAVEDSLLIANPCRIRGAGSTRRASKTEPASLEELAVIVAATQADYQLMVLLAAWCSLRYGELTELRGQDIDTKQGVIQVRRAVGWLRKTNPAIVTCDCSSSRQRHVVGPPKSDAGVRDVNIPPHLLPDLRAHILRSGAGQDGLLFPGPHGGHMERSGFMIKYRGARETAGRKDLRFHDLRHTGATMAGATGATLAELMARLGHSTPAAAMIYQHAAKGRDAEIAKALSDLAAVPTRRTP